MEWKEVPKHEQDSDKWFEELYKIKDAKEGQLKKSAVALSYLRSETRN